MQRRIRMMTILGFSLASSTFALFLLVLPSMALAQTAPQITNDDLLRLIGFQQVQNLQCGKALEVAQQEIRRLTPEKPPEKSAK